MLSYSKYKSHNKEFAALADFSASQYNLFKVTLNSGVEKQYKSFAKAYNAFKAAFEKYTVSHNDDDYPYAIYAAATVPYVERPYRIIYSF